MYSIEWSRIFSRRRRNGDAPARWLPLVSRTVWALGMTSLFTDISSEMVASILPVYLVLHLGISPLAFGVVDGLYQGAAALVRVAGGIMADRWRRHKEVAALGYGLSAACRLLILVAGSAWGMIAAIITLDRIGKGIRTAPRDALISQRSPSEALATAFGVHRALDAVGAMLGPVMAFVLLATMPGGFDVLFIASLGIAIIGVGAILLFVPARVPEAEQHTPSPAELKAADHVRCPACRSTGTHCPKSVSLGTIVHLLGEGRFRALVLAGAVLSLVTVSDSFIYLTLQRRLNIGLSAFPLFYVGTSLVTSLFAIPCGRIADRFGRVRMMLAGYVVLAVVYGVLLLPPTATLVLVAATVLGLGLFYAATDGVLTALAAAELPLSHAGSGLAILATATNLARLAASVVFGFLWSRASMGSATACYLVALTVALICVALFLKRGIAGPAAHPTT